MTRPLTKLGDDALPQGGAGGYVAPYREPLVMECRAALLAEWESSTVKKVNLQERSFDMDIQFCQQNDVGLPLVIQVVDQNGNQVNLFGATDLSYLVQFPDGMLVSRTAQFLTDGSDGKLVYTTQGGDLAQFGYYAVQPHFTLGGSTLSGELQVLSVQKNAGSQFVAPIPDANAASFIQADLVNGILTIHHYKGLLPPYQIQLSIFDNNGRQVTPDSVTGSENSVAVDLTSYAPIVGTWGWIYL